MRWRVLLLLTVSLLLSSCTQERRKVTETGGLTGPEMAALRDTVIRLARKCCLSALDSAGAIVIFVHPEVIYMEAKGPIVNPQGDTLWMNSTMLFVLAKGKWTLALSRGRPFKPGEGCSLYPSPG